MTAALDDGQVRAYVLGLGVDPLTFATDLLAAVVFDGRDLRRAVRRRGRRQRRRLRARRRPVHRRPGRAVRRPRTHPGGRRRPPPPRLAPPRRTARLSVQAVLVRPLLVGSDR